MNTPLQKAAQAMIDRWDSPYWKHAPTADYIDELRRALDAELAQSGEPEVLMVDAAMVEMKNIVPPLRRSECLRLIRAAINATAHPPRPQAMTPCKPLTDDQVINAMCEDGCERIESFYFAGPVQKAAVWSFARAIEAALLKARGEKP